ncbi:probable N-acetyltransferase CML1 [Fukomys damarensis]|uniref:probable N-acetyltransferase CML1 n=1 Tax=Fukomys damarensis TaxID=885580 RepID=UPI00053F68FF|nr:probable N-acetyltransferase CML1 [Fukomys damarensis]XP_010607862.1 probable N-acetyltransferase CML1 [Fukomys damarensis]XP_010607863.1 probable N-acetyltransferase CML1 [Fukomys damarensis]XP_010607865.1 probable N-acetyltransferase CML1 [Fukomys damarensis]XP_019060858.1 probable N-acetyltransferase CML1 [Fukomys damarensis]
MTPHHIRTYRERDRKPVLDLFCRGMTEHVPATFRHMLMLPGTLLIELGVPLSLLLFSGSWLLAITSSLTLLLLLWFLARYNWKLYVATCLRTDMADITKSYLSACGSCFWVAECGGQVVGTVCALPVKNPPLGKKQLKLFHLSVAKEHRGEGIAKNLVRTVLQFARDQGYVEVVLETNIIQRSALALYQGMGFRKTGHYFLNIIWRLAGIPIFHLLYQLPSAREGGL